MNYREFEETLCRLPSVDAARVVGDGERVTEVHVLSAPDKTPKQVVRDVQSLAMARFGTNIDRRVISVVQISPEDLPDVRQGGERPKILGIEETPTGNRGTVAVTLAWQGEEYVGNATGPAGATTRLRLVGEATLRALEGVLGGSPPLALDAITASAVGARNVIIAVVVSADGTNEEVSVGSALSNGEDTDAAVRAILDAFNRRIPQLMR